MVSRLLLAALMASSAAAAGCGIGTAGDPEPASTRSTARSSPEPVRPPRIVVRTTTLRLVDRRRVVRRRTGATPPRRLTTIVRYPVIVGGTSADRAKRHPLVIFGHGYGLTPRSYASLLRRWAQAGYVVAAPAFPGERADAPGGPDRSDLVNEPADMRFVMETLLARSRRQRGALAGIIDPERIAVSGHSDGGNTALAVAFDPRFRSRRIDAAVILAGADLPGLPPFAFPAGGPPLLAVQGTADPVNPQADTNRFFVRARAPKMLLTLPGAGHFDPYMRSGPQLRAVKRVTTGFLDGALGVRRVSDRALRRLARPATVARLRVVR